MQNNPHIPFTGTPELAVCMPATATILDYYKLFIQQDIMDMIVIETNDLEQRKMKTGKSFTPTTWREFSSW